MVQVYLGIGSNVERERHIRSALDALQAQLGALTVSPVVETEAHGRPAPPYFNLVVGARTGLGVGALKQLLRQIEAANGRRRDGGQNGLCTLDIDLLLYGDVVGEVDGVSLPHPDLVQRAYVLYPLALLAPLQLHPGLQRDFGELWQSLQTEMTEPAPATFHWQPASS